MLHLLMVLLVKSIVMKTDGGNSMTQSGGNLLASQVFLLYCLNDVGDSVTLAYTGSDY